MCAGDKAAVTNVQRWRPAEGWDGAERAAAPGPPRQARRGR